jgi:adenylate kinase family enzyme
MIIEIMGPRNAGKTTLMDAVTQRDRDVAYFSLGAATRREIAMDSPAGRDMLMYMRKGAYPPGYLVQYVSEQLNGIKQEKVGVDGIPRQSYEVNDFRAIVKNTCRDCVGIAEISAQKHILLDRSRHRV